MKGRWSETAETVRAALVGLFAYALVCVPLLTGSATLGAPELAAISLVVLALAGTLAACPFLLTSLPGLLNGPVVATTTDLRVLRTRPTDPTHHPLAPRAPGLA